MEMTASGRTARQGAAYAAPADGGPADFTVSCHMEKLMARYPKADKSELEYIGTAGSFARKLIGYQGFVLHSSSVAFQERAYLFSAYSGTGKSTHTEKWIRLFGAELINDDKPALRKEEGIWYAYGTPWSGKGDNNNLKVPVGGLAFLKRGEENHIQKISLQEAFLLIYPQIPYGGTKEEREQLLSLAEQFLKDVPVWLLTCKNEDAAAELAMHAMTGGRENDENN